MYPVDAYRIDGTDSPGQGIGAAPPGSSAPGGFGLLVDLFGTDTYDAPKGQGAGWGYSLGILLDLDGNDRYITKQQAQGWGCDSGSGLLIDYKGDDAYSCVSGSGQGGGSDLGFGLLIDKNGNDQFSGGRRIGGVGMRNGIGICVDEAGDDLHATLDPPSSLGCGFPASGFGSVGLFIDLGGRDVYTGTDHGDGSLWTSGSWGCGIDSDNEEDQP